MSDPVDPRYKAKLTPLARDIDQYWNGSGGLGPKKIGFALFVFETGRIDEGRLNYISNCRRDDMIAAVKEWLAKAEGRASPEPGHG